MGYTNYWHQDMDFTDKEWRTLQEEVKYMQEISNGIIDVLQNDDKEIAFNGKLSALMTTKSYRWIFYTGTSFIITTPYRILKTIANNKLYPVEFTGKGDRHSTLAYFIKQTMLEDAALKVQS